MATRISPVGTHKVDVHYASFNATDDDDWVSSVDTKDHKGVMINININGTAAGLTSTNFMSFTLKASDDNTTFTNVKESEVDGDMDSDGVLVKRTTAVAAAGVDLGTWGYLGAKRYIRVGYDAGGSGPNAAAPCTAAIVLTNPRYAPV